jgi:hypothetical protein
VRSSEGNRCRVDESGIGPEQQRGGNRAESDREVSISLVRHSGQYECCSCLPRSLQSTVVASCRERVSKQDMHVTLSSRAGFLPVSCAVGASGFDTVVTPGAEGSRSTRLVALVPEPGTESLWEDCWLVWAAGFHVEYAVLYVEFSAFLLRNKSLESDRGGIVEGCPNLGSVVVGFDASLLRTQFLDSERGGIVEGCPNLGFTVVGVSASDCVLEFPSAGRSIDSGALGMPRELLWFIIGGVSLCCVSCVEEPDVSCMEDGAVISASRRRRFSLAEPFESTLASGINSSAAGRLRTGLD